MIFPLIKNEKFQSLKSNKIFLELFCFVISLITILGWTFNFLAGAITLLVVSIATILLFWDLKMIIPIILNCIFLINNEFKFTTDNFPIVLPIMAALFLIILIIYLCFNGIDFKKGKNKIAFLLFAIFAILPIFWMKVVDANDTVITLTKEQSFLKLLYFNWLIYFFIYIIFLNGIKEDSMDITLKSFTYIPLVLMVEEIITTTKDPNWFNHMNSLAVNMGWGIGNEAGIMILFVLPFIFYRFIKGDMKVKILSSLMVITSIVVTIFTFSRGGYLAIPLEILFMIFLYLLYAFKTSNANKKAKIELIIFSSVVALLTIVGVLLALKFDLFKKVFNGNYGTSHRTDLLYPQAFRLWTSSPLNFLLGSGIINRIDKWNRFVVYHSTLFETMAVMGLMGLITMAWHFYVKYKTVLKNFDLLGLFVLVSYLCTDAYGMLDNTYHMYYFMTYLCLFLAIYERHIELTNLNTEMTKETF